LPLRISLFNAPPHDQRPASTTSATIAELRQPPYDQHVTAGTPGEFLGVFSGSVTDRIVDFAVQRGGERQAVPDLQGVKLFP
jgi:hypothetical protein